MTRSPSTPLNANDTTYPRGGVSRVSVRSNTIGVGLGTAASIMSGNPNFYSPIAASVNALLPAYQTVYRKGATR